MITDESMGEQVNLQISESSQVADARQRVTALAVQAGFNEVRAGACAVIASEMGTNLVKHAKGGELFLRPLSHTATRGIEILALDRGPGMGNLTRALRDGHSTSGSSGTGLGAIGRMASEFDIQSMPGRGTALVARIWDSPPSGTRESLPTVIGVISRAMPGETLCGDGWFYNSSDRRTVCAIVDGLGHGALAAEASTRAIESLRSNGGIPLVDKIDRAHAALRATRGAALGVAEILHDQCIVKFSGIGNIMAT